MSADVRARRANPKLTPEYLAAAKRFIEASKASPDVEVETVRLLVMDVIDSLGERFSVEQRDELREGVIDALNWERGR